MNNVTELIMSWKIERSLNENVALLAKRNKESSVAVVRCGETRRDDDEREMYERYDGMFQVSSEVQQWSAAVLQCCRGNMVVFTLQQREKLLSIRKEGNVLFNNTLSTFSFTVI